MKRGIVILNTSITHGSVYTGDQNYFTFFRSLNPIYPIEHQTDQCNLNNLSIVPKLLVIIMLIMSTCLLEKIISKTDNSSIPCLSKKRRHIIFPPTFKANHPLLSAHISNKKSARIMLK